MRICDLIDFYLAIRTPDQLLGFDSLYENELEELKRKIQEYYGTHEEWLSRDEKEELPEELSALAAVLVEKHEAWKG